MQRLQADVARLKEAEAKLAEAEAQLLRLAELEGLQGQLATLHTQLSGESAIRTQLGKELEAAREQLAGAQADATTARTEAQVRPWSSPGTPDQLSAGLRAALAGPDPRPWGVRRRRRLRRLWQRRWRSCRPSRRTWTRCARP